MVPPVPDMLARLGLARHGSRNDWGVSPETDVALAPICDYETSAGKTCASAAERNRKQQGEPALAADAIVQAITSLDPPLHLVLGKFAYDRMSQKLDDFRREMETWRALGLGTDFKS